MNQIFIFKPYGCYSLVNLLETSDKQQKIHITIFCLKYCLCGDQNLFNNQVYISVINEKHRFTLCVTGNSYNQHHFCYFSLITVCIDPVYWRPSSKVSPPSFKLCYINNITLYLLIYSALTLHIVVDDEPSESNNNQFKFSYLDISRPYDSRLCKMKYSMTKSSTL